VAYSLDLRKRVVEFVEEGGSRVEAAARFKVSLWCVKDWLKRKNSLAPGKPGPQGSWKLNRNTLKITVEGKPDATLDELAQEMGTGRTAIWHALKQMKISRKKNVAIR
jgi:transposase